MDLLHDDIFRYKEREKTAKLFGSYIRDAWKQNTMKIIGLPVSVRKFDTTGGVRFIRKKNKDTGYYRYTEKKINLKYLLRFRIA